MFPVIYPFLQKIDENNIEVRVPLTLKILYFIASLIAIGFSFIISLFVGSFLDDVLKVNTKELSHLPEALGYVVFLFLSYFFIFSYFLFLFCIFKGKED